MKRNHDASEDATPLNKLKFTPKGECSVCLGSTGPDEMRCRTTSTWFRFCSECVGLCSVCPQCHDPACFMPNVNMLYQRDLMTFFTEGCEHLAGMNPTMFVEFSETTVVFGVSEFAAPPTRSAYASADAFVRDDKGEVKLRGDNKFVAWSVERHSTTSLARDVSMVRTMLKSDETLQTQDLGSAEKWTRVLLYGDEKLYPTLVGHTLRGERVKIALACNPSLPGFLLKSHNSDVGRTVLSAVDIPAQVYGSTPLFQDPRVFVFQRHGEGGCCCCS